MTQNITTSQVINEHCSCCHGNYYHSNVANGIWGRAREICENYCQIQLGSFRLNSAVRPPGPSLISYQIKRGIEMLELTPWCESHHGVLTPADWGRLTLSSNLNQHHCWHISISCSAACHLQQGYNCSDNTGVLVRFTPLFSAESVRAGKRTDNFSLDRITPFIPFGMFKWEIIYSHPYFTVLFRPQIRGLSLCSLLKKAEACLQEMCFLDNVSIIATILAWWAGGWVKRNKWKTVWMFKSWVLE